jgi:hypothetical protein
MTPGSKWTSAFIPAKKSAKLGPALDASRLQPARTSVDQAADARPQFAGEGLQGMLHGPSPQLPSHVSLKSIVLRPSS